MTPIIFSILEELYFYFDLPTSQKAQFQSSIISIRFQYYYTRCPTASECKLGEILGCIAVIIGLHKQLDGLALVPTNLPHLQFTQVCDFHVFPTLLIFPIPYYS